MNSIMRGALGVILAGSTAPISVGDDNVRGAARASLTPESIARLTQPPLLVRGSYLRLTSDSVKGSYYGLCWGHRLGAMSFCDFLAMLIVITKI